MSLSDLIKSQLTSTLQAAAINAVQASVGAFVPGGISSIATAVTTIQNIPAALSQVHSSITTVVSTQVAAQLQTALTGIIPQAQSAAPGGEGPVVSAAPAGGGRYVCQACTRRAKKRRGRKTRSTKCLV